MEDQLLELKKLILERQQPNENISALKFKLEEQESVNSLLTKQNNDFRANIEVQRIKIDLLKDEKKTLLDENADLRLKLKETTNCVQDQMKTLSQFNDKLERAEKLVFDQRDCLETLSKKVENDSKNNIANLNQLYTRSVESMANETNVLKKSLRKDFELEKDQMQSQSENLKKAIGSKMSELENANKSQIDEMREQVVTFQENAKMAIGSHSNENRNVCYRALDQKKDEIKSEVSNEMEELRADLKDDINSNVDIMNETIDKLSTALDDVEKSQKSVNNVSLIKDLGEYYHQLVKAKSTDSAGISSQGIFIQKVIEECIDETKFSILLEELDDGVLEWCNPDNNNMNALQLSWTIEGAEKLTNIITLRSSDEIIQQSENQVLGEWSEKLETVSNDLQDRIALYQDAIDKGSSKVILKFLRGKLGFDFDMKILGDWSPKVISAMEGNTLGKSKLLFDARASMVSEEVFTIMRILLGEEAYGRMYGHVTFDPSNNNVKTLSNNNMTIGGNFKDNEWHGALMNINISNGQIAEWEIKIDSTDEYSNIGLGIYSTSSPSKWYVGGSDFIGVDCSNGYKYIKRSGSQYASKLNAKDVVRLQLDMIKCELSLHINNVDKGVLASGLKENKWWPCCVVFNRRETYGHACSLKSFRFISPE
eukprot:TRINITY_DN4928_c0_g1_i1.p1 TRINITY_DN4928_c0_g1~~TRINITY_DN4928_c0_g1_i1.p1  ORF type:complete len:654 (-),score=199.73 TRINITY_DN4928_c0_g1_i1:210-2171(-)